MTFKYKLHPNPLKNGENKYRAYVAFDGTLGLDQLVDLMEFRSSTITKADTLAVLEEYHRAIIRAILDGKQVSTDLILFTASMQGNFDSEDDLFDASRHTLVVRARPTSRFKQQITTEARFKKVIATEPAPLLKTYHNLYNGSDDMTLSPSHTAQIKGRYLSFNPNDPQQGLFVVPQQNGTPPADPTPIRVEELSRHTSREIIFRVPDGLPAGDYKLEVRAIFGNDDLRTGAFKQTLTV